MAINRENSNSKLIELKDGTLVQIESIESSGLVTRNQFIDKVSYSLKNNLESIEPALVEISRPIASAFSKIRQEHGIEVEKAEVEVGFNFEATGNIFITHSKSNASLNVKLVLKNPKNES